MLKRSLPGKLGYTDCISRDVGAADCAQVKYSQSLFRHVLNWSSVICMPSDKKIPCSKCNKNHQNLHLCINIVLLFDTNAPTFKPSSLPASIASSISLCCCFCRPESCIRQLPIHLLERLSILLLQLLKASYYACHLTMFKNA